MALGLALAANDLNAVSSNDPSENEKDSETGEPMVSAVRLS